MSAKFIKEKTCYESKYINTVVWGVYGLIVLISEWAERN